MDDAGAWNSRLGNFQGSFLATTFCPVDLHRVSGSIPNGIKETALSRSGRSEAELIETQKQWGVWTRVITGPPGGPGATPETVIGSRIQLRHKRTP